MSDTQNGSHESIDTSPLRPDQLSDAELSIVLSIEDQLTNRQFTDRTTTKNQKPYLAPIQVRHPQVLLLNGARGTGKTSLLLTMAHRWNRYDDCDIPRGEANDGQYMDRVERIRKRLQIQHDGTPPKNLHPLRILDFDPLPPQMPLLAGLVQAWQPLAKEYASLATRSDECGGAVETLQDRWDKLFRVSAVGWSPVPAAKGLLEQVLDRQEQVTDWQRLGHHWYEFVTNVIESGKCLRNEHRLCGEPVFVLMIDDVDLQVERIRELLPALRLLYHPNVVFLVAADWDHLIDTLELDFLGQQHRLVNHQRDRRDSRTVWSAAGDDKWAGILAEAAATKVFPRKNQWHLKELTLYEFLAFPKHEHSLEKTEDGGTNDRTTMKAILNEWPRKSKVDKKDENLGDYLFGLLRRGEDVYEISSFITYRDAHQIFGRASMESGEEARAIETVRCLISDSGSEATSVGNGAETEPIVEYNGVGQLVARFRSGYFEQLSTSSSIVLGAHPRFYHHGKRTSETAFPPRPGDAMFRVSRPMLAVTMQDAGYGVSAPDLQWNVRLALVWTTREVIDDNAPLRLAFQWRFHEHPSPIRLWAWSYQWRDFVRSLQKSAEKKEERIAYAWIYYQLKWLGTEMGSAPHPLGIESIDEVSWTTLLDLEPPVTEDSTGDSLGAQDWKTQTLPLLARPEIGLPPELQCRLLKEIELGEDSGDQQRQREWLKVQQRRLVTDAIIAAEEAEGRSAEDAENEKRVRGILKGFEKEHKNTHGVEQSPWSRAVADPAKDGP